MQRREFMKLMASVSLVSPSLLLAGENFTPYEGELYIVIHAEGGWDISSFCDPKANVTINTWAKTDAIVKTSSQVSYAPFAKNRLFFETHHKDMLIINGIDTQTNAHNAGVRHMFSGRFDEGYPSFGALFSSIKAPKLPLSYISNGAYNYTASLTHYTLMQNPTSLSNLINPNETPYGNNNFHHPTQKSIIEKYSKARLQRALDKDSLTPSLHKTAQSFFDALNSKSDLSRLKTYLPKNEDLAPLEDEKGNYNPLLRQAQLSLVAMKAGLCATSDLKISGFDTHANHDVEHALALSNLQDGVMFLWREAERLGIANRLTLFISSDFSRTPEYNDGKGKDHWPSASAIFMRKNASWGGRVIGKTDDNLGALALNSNLEVDESGTIIEPRHIQNALRKLASINDDTITQNFPLDSSDIDLFKMFS